MAGSIEPEDLVVGAGWMIAQYPRVQCAYIGPAVADDEFEAYLERFDADIKARKPGETIGVLYYVQNATMDSPRRRRFAKALDDNREKLTQTTAAYVLVTSSAFARGVLTTLFWLAPPGYPYKVVGSVGQGLEFIEGHLAGVDVAGITASFTELLGTRMRVAS